MDSQTVVTLLGVAASYVPILGYIVKLESRLARIETKLRIEQ